MIHSTTLKHLSAMGGGNVRKKGKRRNNSVVRTIFSHSRFEIHLFNQTSFHLTRRDVKPKNKEGTNSISLYTIRSRFFRY